MTPVLLIPFVLVLMGVAFIRNGTRRLERGGGLRERRIAQQYVDAGKVITVASVIAVVAEMIVLATRR